MRPYRVCHAAPPIPRRTPPWSHSLRSGTHNPAEDACAALRLYKLKMSEWEKLAGKGVGGGAAVLPREMSGWERGLLKGKSDQRKQRKRKRGTN